MTTTTEIAVITPEEFTPVIATSGIEKVTTYAAMFVPFLQTVKELSQKAATIKKVEPDATDAKLAREIRLAMVKNRTATGKQKDLGKANLLAETNLIQSLHNVVINTSTLIESELEAVEKYAENKEKERKQLLQKRRAEQLSQYIADCSLYDLANMTDEVFANLLESQRLLHEQKIAEAARLEAERIEREAEELRQREAQRIENERLKKELAEKEAAIIAERKQQEELQRKQAAEQQAKLDAERKEREKIVAELKAKQLEEERLRKEKEAAEKAAALAAKKAAAAPDKKKIESALNNLPAIVFGELKSAEAVAVANEINAKFAAFKSWALTQTTNL